MKAMKESPLTQALNRINAGEFEYEYKSHTKPLREMNIREREQAIATRREMQELDGQMRTNCRTMLAELYGLVGHPKEQKVWDMAWDMGHASGWSEVAIQYDNLADLVL